MAAAQVANVLRWGALGTLLISCGLALRIALLYQFGTPREGAPLARLRTFHVAALSYAWTLLSGGYALEVYNRLGQPLAFRGFVGLTAGSLALAGMVTVTRIVARIGPVYSARERLVRERGERRTLENAQELRRATEDDDERGEMAP